MFLHTYIWMKQRQWIDLTYAVANSRDSNGFTIQLPRGCLTVYTLRDTIIPLVRSGGSPRKKNNI